MLKGHVPLFVAIVLSVSACTSHIVSDRFIVDRTVMLTDADAGDPIPPLCNEDVISEGALGEGTNQGMMVKPSDVVHLAIWSPGRQLQGANSKLHLTPPTFDLLRLPIRNVFVLGSATGAKEWFELSALDDSERLFLANALTTNRKGELGNGDSQQWIATHLVKHEVMLWNALVDSLRVRRVDPSGGTGKDCTDANGKIRKLTVDDMERIRKSVVSMTFDMTQLSKQLGGGDRTAFEAAFKQETAADIAGFAEGASTPYSELAGKQNAFRNNSYYRLNANSSLRAFLNFVSVEINGIDFRSPQMPERAWSLYTVEASGVCGDGAKIAEFTFADGWATFSVVDDAETAGYEVKRLNVNRQGAHPPYQVGTEIRPKKSRLFAMLNGTSVHRHDLANIYISDVKRIVWRGISMDKNAASLRMRCLMN